MADIAQDNAIHNSGEPSNTQASSLSLREIDQFDRVAELRRKYLEQVAKSASELK